MKKQGTIKAIPVKEVTESMQVIYKHPNLDKPIIGKVSHITEKRCTILESNNNGFGGVNILELKTLVVEYKSEQSGENVWTNQLSIKYSQWQAILDNNEINKNVEFEISGINQCDGCQKGLPIENGIHKDNQRMGISCTKNRYPIYAKIIPVKKRMYTEEEMRESFKNGVEAGKIFNDYPFWGNTFNSFIKSLN